MLRRFLSILLLLTLAVPAMPLGAQDNPVLTLEDTGSIRAVLPEAEGLLLYGQSGLYAWHVGEEVLRMVAATHKDAAPYDTILWEGTGLWGLRSDAQQVFPLTLTDGALIPGVPVDLSMAQLLRQAADDGVFGAPQHALMHQGRLYLIYRGEQEGRPTTALLSFSLADGSGKWHEGMHVQFLAPYRDDKLLALVLDEGRYYNPELAAQPKPILAVYDPVEDSLTELGPTGVDYARFAHGMAYDRQADTVYLLSGGNVYAGHPGQAITLFADAPQEVNGPPAVGEITLLTGGYIAMAQGNKLLVRPTDKQAAVPRLKIYGDTLGPALWSTIEALRGQMLIEASEFPPYSDMKELAENLLLENDRPDIYCVLSSQYDLEVIKQKGYCADLSGSPTLAAFVKSTYPAMQAIATQGDQLLMVPYAAIGEEHGYHPSCFEEVGLGVPTTFDELCDLIDMWNDDYVDRYPDIRPVNTDDIPQMLVRLAVNLYTNYCAHTGQEFSFQSPMLRAMLERAQTVSFDNIMGNTGATRSLVDGGYYYFAPQMLSWHIQEPNTPAPLQLAMRAGDPVVNHRDLYVLVVDPRSEQRDAAIRFLETYVDRLTPETVVTLNPSVREEVIDPASESWWPNLIARRDMMQQVVDEAQGAEKTEAQANLDSFLLEMQQWENQRYLVSEQGIARYRALYENGYIRSYGSDYMGLPMRELMRLQLRYAWRQTTLDEFLAEAEQRMRLMRLESR